MPYTRADLVWLALAGSGTLVLALFYPDTQGVVERLPLVFLATCTLVLLLKPWIQKRFAARRDRVWFDDTGIHRIGAAGARESIGWSALARIEVALSDTDFGPPERFWLLLDRSGKSGCAVPANTPGLEEVLAEAGRRKDFSLPDLDISPTANQPRKIVWFGQETKRR